MLSYCTNYLATIPDLTVYMNCDTRLAVNLRTFDFGENDEFIFVIKNYDYIDSPYVFLFRARKDDMDENGEVLFKITPAISRRIKPGAFYNFSILADAFNPKKETVYKKLTDNGNIILEYGAQDIAIKTELSVPGTEIVSARLELMANDYESTAEPLGLLYEISGIRLESID